MPDLVVIGGGVVGLALADAWLADAWLAEGRRVAFWGDEEGKLEHGAVDPAGEEAARRANSARCSSSFLRSISFTRLSSSRSACCCR